MSDIIQSTPLPLPQPRVDITIRPGTIDDLPFIDSLQKKQSRQVGFFPTKALEGKIRSGHVLIAEKSVGCDSSHQSPDGQDGAMNRTLRKLQTSVTPVGYLIGNDQYFKRDDVGIIYQMNVLPEYRRSLVAATLLKAQFERSAYGCKLYCCWCAQDIQANRFWESMGFVPLAYRAGGKMKYEGGGMKDEGGGMKDEKEGPSGSLSSFILHTSSFASKARVHIFWQKRIRQDDTTTPWWFPSKTDAGAIRADRIVLPIPPGLHWADPMPILQCNPTPQIEPPAEKPRRIAGRTAPAQVAARVGMSRSGMWFTPASIPQPRTPKPPKPKPTKQPTDPRIIAAARELRDRYLEHDYAQQIVPVAKYDVSRAIHATTSRLIDATTPLLAA